MGVEELMKAESLDEMMERELICAKPCSDVKAPLSVQFWTTQAAAFHALPRAGGGFCGPPPAVASGVWSRL